MNICEIIINIIRYYFEAGHLQLYAWNNHVCSVRSVASVLLLQFVLHVILFPVNPYPANVENMVSS